MQHYNFMGKHGTQPNPVGIRLELIRENGANVLIDYQRLTELLGFDAYDEVKIYHRRWADDYLENGRDTRDEKWTGGIAFGSEGFIEKAKSLMGALAIRRKGMEAGDSCQPQEPAAPYIAHLGAKRTI